MRSGLPPSAVSLPNTPPLFEDHNTKSIRKGNIIKLSHNVSATVLPPSVRGVDCVARRGERMLYQHLMALSPSVTCGDSSLSEGAKS